MKDQLKKADAGMQRIRAEMGFCTAECSHMHGEGMFASSAVCEKQAGHDGAHYRAANCEWQ